MMYTHTHRERNTHIEIIAQNDKYLFMSLLFAYGLGEDEHGREAWESCA